MDASDGNDKVRKLLDRWRERARTVQKAHYGEEERLQRLHYWLGIPTILLSAAVATMMLVLIRIVGEDWVKLLFGMLGFVSAFLSTLQTFFKFSERASAHHSVAVKYGQINRKLERILAEPLPTGEEQKALTREIEKDLNSAAEDALVIPRRSEVPDEVTPTKV